MSRAEMHQDDKSRLVPSLPRHVWIFARPLSATAIFPTFGFTSHGKFHLCHWGVLVSEFDLKALQEIMSRPSGDPEIDEMPLGVMWELFRTEQNTNSINVTRPLRLATIREQWSTDSAERVGITALDDEGIQKAGMRRFCHDNNK